MWWKHAESRSDSRGEKTVSGTLVTFLGKGRENPETGYRKAKYRFEDRIRETAYFGLAMAEYLRPEQLIILGTRGSQWDLLVENVASSGVEEEARVELIDAVVNARVEQPLLDRLTSVLTAALGRKVVPRLIPYGKDGAEQNEILETIARVIPRGEVSFDLTHGFRHLGMVGFLSAFMMERIGKLDVRGLWYGALDMTENGVTPVLRLDGLTSVQRWIDALDQFEATGDYGVFAELLAADGVKENKTRCLKEAAFFERTFNVADAARKLQSFLPVLDQPLRGASGLFQAQLKKRLDWVREASLEAHQRRLAYQYLDRGDYVRATIFAWEALVTRECKARGYDPNNFRNGREPAIDEFEEEIQADAHPDWKRHAYWRLKNLRNALAHGLLRSNARERQILRDPAGLHRELEASFKRLLG